MKLLEPESEYDLVLIDGSSLFYRALGTKLFLKTSKGENVTVLYLSIRSLLTWINRFKPRFVVIVRDGGKDAHRVEIYPEYKKGRRKDWSEEKKTHFFGQIDKFFEIITFLPVVSMGRSGMEADDIIGLCVKRWLEKDSRTRILIVSADADFYQLIGDRVHQYHPRYAYPLVTGFVKKKYKVSPSQWVDYVSIVGDSSDNISGIAGLGPKKAQQILNKYGSLENFYSTVDPNNADFVERILLSDEAVEILQRNKRIITLPPEWLVAQELQVILGCWRQDKFFEILTQLEMISLLSSAACMTRTFTKMQRELTSKNQRVFDMKDER